MLETSGGEGRVKCGHVESQGEATRTDEVKCRDLTWQKSWIHLGPWNPMGWAVIGFVLGQPEEALPPSSFLCKLQFGNSQEPMATWLPVQNSKRKRPDPMTKKKLNWIVIQITYTKNFNPNIDHRGLCSSGPFPTKQINLNRLLYYDNLELTDQILPMKKPNAAEKQPISLIKAASAYYLHAESFYDSVEQKKWIDRSFYIDEITP